MSRPPIDTTHFMSKYHHPKNVAAANGDPNSRVTIKTSYSRSKGIYRQKQIDEEIERIRARKRPSSSKITITISTANLLTLHHHHHHCLDFQLTSRSGKGRVVWFWDAWETATDERVMKGAIAALDSSWGEDGIRADAMGKDAPREVISGDKRKPAAIAAELRMKPQKPKQNQKKYVEVIDLLDSD